MRLVLFILAVFCLVKWFNSNPLLAALSSLSALILLLIIAGLSTSLTARKAFCKELIRINEEEIGALDWKFDGFNPGTEYLDTDHPYTSDLDIFGENSLFQYLNRTSISKGRDQLAAWLSRPIPAEEIIRRQGSVKELSQNFEWRQEFLATGRMSEETREDYMQLQQWLGEKLFLAGKKFYAYMLYILPALTMLSLILAFVWIPYNIPIFLVLIQLGIVGINLRIINHHHNQISRKYKLIEKFSRLIKQIEESEFSSEYLLRLQKNLFSSGIKAGQQLHRLARLVVRFDRRLNMIMGFILNGLLMWDLHCLLWLERWKIANAKEMPAWFEILGEFEALNSFACFHFNNPWSVFPEFSPPNTIIEAESIGHPLIPSRENIRNNIRIGEPGEFMLITGSNMAGKSTFLRTVGVNMILAGAGAPVIADRMTWHPVRIFTSMRVKDSLSSRESTFYAELKRLHLIIESIKTGQKMLVILDEILKGTNSRDKHLGSDMFIRQLISEGCVGLIATHDLALGRLEEEFPDTLTNYCFEVQIENGEFHYDYKLRKGICQTMNATELMKKMGISINAKK
jgi:DNA mismatch repair ATPase MutS